jgi:hypothetical protein
MKMGEKAFSAALVGACGFYFGVAPRTYRAIVWDATTILRTDASPRRASRIRGCASVGNAGSFRVARC